MTSNDLKHIAVDSEKYQEYLLENATFIANKIKDDAYIAASMGEQNAKSIVHAVEQVKIAQEQKHQKEELAYQRVLKQEEHSQFRAGYINAAILLFSTVFFGILLACALILLQN